MSSSQERVFNFSAGPATLPLPVLERARDELTDWRGSGMGVMEMSHRSKEFLQIVEETESDLRTLLGGADGFKALFLQGGASLQFTMVALNLLRPESKAQYVVTGSWGKKAVAAAKLHGEAETVWDGKADNYDRLPDRLELDESASYVHYTSNETIQGVEFQDDPDFPGVTVCDLSSNALSRPIDLTKHDLIYAGAQKNLGPSGVCLVLVRESLLETVPEGLPPMLDYRQMAESDSMYNTPPCFSIYMLGLNLKHLIERGGLEEVAKHNAQKAKVLYDAIDASDGFFKGHAVPEARSKMNVTFTLPDDDKTKAFVAGALERGMRDLKGHRSVGGCRASVYNAFPIEGCHRLAEFMAEFQRTSG